MPVRANGENAMSEFFGENNLRFLSNTRDPNDKNARMYVTCRSDETESQAWEHYCNWLNGKIIGEPKATDTYTSAELRDMGMVGVYVIDIEPLVFSLDVAT